VDRGVVAVDVVAQQLAVQEQAAAHLQEAEEVGVDVLKVAEQERLVQAGVEDEDDSQDRQSAREPGRDASLAVASVSMRVASLQEPGRLRPGCRAPRVPYTAAAPAGGTRTGERPSDRGFPRASAWRMQEPDASATDRFLTAALVLWAGTSALFLAVNAALLLVAGRAVFSTLVRVGPVSGLKLTYSALALVWLAGGLALALLRRPAFRARHGLLAVCCFLTLALYANVLRERSEYPDAGDYMRAAIDLAAGRPLDEFYIYPPLLAAALEPLVPFGRGALRGALWISNLLAVSAFTGLLALALARYGFERRLSALLALAFVSFNVPVLRTLVYGQVNLHVANLILLALLFHPRFPAGSGLALALAAHLKSSPVLLAPPFLTQRSWRWAVAFAASLLAVAGAIYAVHGAQPFLDFQHNARGVYAWPEPRFRENSIDNFFRNTAAIVGGPLAVLGFPGAVLAAKAAVLVLALWVSTRAVRYGAFAPRGDAAGHVLNAWPALAVLMVLASPLVWEHHPVFTALSFLVITRRLAGPAEWAVFSLAYGVVYLLPTFDFYPWSFGRLLGLLVLLVLLLRASGERPDGAAFLRLHERLARVPSA
jgi:hypothetical protein